RRSAKGQRFEQGIGSQAVGSVDGCGSNFAGRIQTSQAGTTTQVGSHTTHEVMRCRRDRNVIVCDIETVIEAGCIHVPEFIPQYVCRYVSHVEKNLCV